MIEKNQQLLCMKHSEYATQVQLDEQLKGQQKYDIQYFKLTAINNWQNRKKKTQTKQLNLLSYSMRQFNHFHTILQEYTIKKERYEYKFQSNQNADLKVYRRNERFKAKIIFMQCIIGNFLIESEIRQIKEIAANIHYYYILILSNIIKIIRQNFKFQHQFEYNFDIARDNAQINLNNNNYVKFQDLILIILKQLLVLVNNQKCCIYNTQDHSQCDWPVSRGDDSFQCVRTSQEAIGRRVGQNKQAQVRLHKQLQMIKNTNQFSVAFKENRDLEDKLRQQLSLRIIKSPQTQRKVYCFSLSKSHDLMISCSDDNQIVIWGKAFKESSEFKQFIITQRKRIQSVFFLIQQYNNYLSFLRINRKIYQQQQ
ncbi:unnamed protein product [Paramecium pentaurelia]|uniref:Uncharacterized protein n=1 Tax=Paramecium pentaurelia TaxID=43138 RepID=A0A8S1W4C9_9CILI|nr:unnamed protein product [Paramecium pentaurelia]